MKASDRLLQLKLPKSKLEQRGIYFLLKDDEVVYVGKTITGYSRIKNHIPNKDFDSFVFIDMPHLGDSELIDIEDSYITKYTPIYNNKFGSAYNGTGYLSSSAFAKKHGINATQVSKMIKDLKPNEVLSTKKLLTSSLRETYFVRYLEVELIEHINKFIINEDGSVIRKN